MFFKTRIFFFYYKHILNCRIKKFFFRWVSELLPVINILNLTSFASISSYICMCGSGSIFQIRIRIRIQEAHKYGSGSTTLAQSCTLDRLGQPPCCGCLKPWRPGEEASGQPGQGYPHSCCHTALHHSYAVKCEMYSRPLGRIVGGNL